MNNGQNSKITPNMTSSINQSFFVHKVKINPQIDSRIVLDQDRVFHKKKNKQEDKVKIKNLKKELHNWINTSLFVTNNSNALDDLDQLLRESKQYRVILQQCKQQKIKFKDDNFKKNSKSLLGYFSKNPQIQAKMNLIGWDSLEHFNKPPFIVYKEIFFDDIIQGALGDCYFLAAISSLAKYPNRLKRLFLIKEYNPLGIYVVALCINGIWQEIILDEYFPVNITSGQPAFNSTKSRQLWVMLLEKAYAKIHGGYYNINRGLCTEALRDLTGASNLNLFLEDYVNIDVLWNELIYYHKNKFVMTTGSGDFNNTGNDDLNKQTGLVGNHAYSILSFKELVFVDGQYKLINLKGQQNVNHQGKQYNVCRLIKLRNPWGKTEWLGPWSDKDKVWNKNLRQLLGHQSQDDGIFFMDFFDFHRMFRDVQVCHYHDDYKYTAVQLKAENGGETFLTLQLEGKNQNDSYFSVNQINERFFSLDKNYKYSYLKIFVFKQVNKKYEFVGSSIEGSRENWIKTKTLPGKYFIYIKTNWRSQVNHFSFSVNSPEKTKIQIVQKKDFPINFINRLFYIHSQTNNNKKDVGHNIVIKKLQLTGKNGYGYIYIENHNKDKIVFFNLQLVVKDNVQVLWPFQSSKPSLIIKPNQKDLIVYESLSENYSSQISYNFIIQQLDQNLFKQIQKDSDFVEQKYYKGNPVKIYEYIFNSFSTIVLSIHNKSEYFVLSQKLKFQLENCYFINNKGSNEYEILCRPGEYQYLIIQQQDQKKIFDCFILEKIEKVECMLDCF